MKIMGISFSNIVTAVALVGSIASPFIWGGKVQAVNDVQDVKIAGLETRTDKIEAKLDDQNDMLRALLLKNGIDPKAVISQR